MTPQKTSLIRIPAVSLLARVLGFLILLTPAFAATAKFDIPAQPAAAALHLFIKQSGAHVVFSEDALKGITTNEVKGEMEPDAALAKLLAGTGFTATRDAQGSFIVAREKTGATGSVEGSLFPPVGSGLKVAGVVVSVVQSGDTATVDAHGRYYIPALLPGTYTLAAAGEGFSRLRIEDVVIKPNQALTLSPEEMPVRLKDGEVQTMAEVVVYANKDVEIMGKVVVTGSKPEPFSDRNVDLPRGIDDVQAYYIFNSQTIEESGTTDVEDFLKQRLTMDTTVQTNAQRTVYQTGSGVAPSTASSINLNGLGTNHTLILVDGIPMAGVSAFTASNLSSLTPGQPDVNGIPMGAIDRIEVLPSSAGAIYGAGAEGGVINIILKKEYNGGDVTATYASTWDGYGPSRTLEATFGHSFERGKTQLFVTAQYSDQSPMLVQDRVNLLNRGYSTLLARGQIGTTAADLGYTSNAPYLSPILGSTTNIEDNTPTIIGNQITYSNLILKNGTSLNSPIATIPIGYGPNSSPSGIIGGQWNYSPGQDNQGPNGLLVPLGNYPRRKSLMATLTRQMTDKLQLHIDFSNDENHSYSNYNPLNGLSDIIISANAPDNPFNQDVQVTFPINFNAPVISNTTTHTVTLGGTLKLPFDWVAHLDYQWSSSTYSTTYANVVDQDLLDPQQTFYGYNSSNTFNGIPDTNPTPFFSGAINPFVDTLANPINLAPLTENVYITGKTTSNDLILAASGPLLHLPWGAPRLSFRLEHNKSGEPGGSIRSSAPTDPSNIYPGMPLNWSSFISYGQTQTMDSANAELDLPIFKSNLPLLRSLDAQFNFSNETTTAGIGTPGYQVINTAYPYNTAEGTSNVNGVVGNYTPASPIIIGGPNTLGAGSKPLSTGAQPYRIKAVNSNTSFTGPALSYKPADDLIIRASIASGYVPPTYSQLVATPISAVTPSIGNNLNDPKTGTKVSGVNVYNLGGNPNLQSQTSKSWNFGAVWEPRSGLLRGLRADAEFTETKQQNLILSAPGAQTLINLESNFPNLVIRNSSGQITTIYNESINVAEAKQDAWTFSLAYPWRTAIGNFELTAAETLQEHNGQQLKTGTQFLEYVGYPNSGGDAKTKATGTLRWSWHNWVAAWTTVFFDGYKQYGAPGDPGAYASQLETNSTYSLNTQYLLLQGGYTVPSQMYHNLYLSYTFRKGMLNPASRWGRWTDGFLDGTRISFNVNNVFNTLPPFDAYYQPFYTSPYGDVQLRNYSISIKKAF